MSTALTPKIKRYDQVVDPNALVIRLGSFKNRLSDDDFFEICRTNRDLRIEMTKDGNMIVMAPTGGEGGNRNFNLTVDFGIWAKTDGTGVGFDSSTGFVLPNGAKRAPDLAWVQLERWKAIPKRQRKMFPPICPDFVVELRSESDSLAPIQEKMEEYIENGAQLGWLIDPIEKKVYIYRPKLKVKTLNHPKQLSGEPLLKGLVLNLRGILD